MSARWGWTEAHRAQKVGIVGATGAVGVELATLLVQAGHPAERIACLARRESTLDAAGVKLRVAPTPAQAADLRAHDLVFLCTPSEISLELGPALAQAGVRTIDLSSALRMRPDVPLVVPEINGRELARAPRLVANPNCTTAIACMPLAVIARMAGLEEVVVVSYQAASGAGAAGLDALRDETRQACGLSPEGGRASPFPATLALNVIPAVAKVGPDGISGEEQKIADETRRILDLPGLAVEATTARVPVERCHSVAVHLRTARNLALSDLLSELRRAPGIEVVDDPHGPRPRECAGRDEVFVGRVRAGARGGRALAYFAVGDQLRKGAALNALQIAAGMPPAV